VLFSIEVTSTYFPVRNYFYSFYCAVVASIANRFLTGSPYVLSTELPRESWVWAELGFHALLGTATPPPPRPLWHGTCAELSCRPSAQA
jgi:H+/Cl- antiporter ClcA